MHHGFVLSGADRARAHSGARDMTRKGMRPTHEEDRFRCRAVPSGRRHVALVTPGGAQPGQYPCAADPRHSLCSFPSSGASMRALPLPARLYVASVLAADCVLVCLAVRNLPSSQVTDVVVLGALYLISESLSSRGSRDLLTISLGSVVMMAAIPLVGVWGAVLVAWTSAFAHEPQATTLVKRAFNGAMLVVSAGAAGGAYHALGGGVGLEAGDFPDVLGPIVAADLVQCAVNGALVAIIVGLSSRVSPLVVFQGTMARSVLSYLAYGLFGVSLAVLWDPV